AGDSEPAGSASGGPSFMCLALGVPDPKLALAQQQGAASPPAPTEPRHDSPRIVLAAGLSFGLRFGQSYSRPSDPSTSPLPTWLDPNVEGSVSSQFPFSLGVAYRPIPLVSFGLAAELAMFSAAGCSSNCNGGALSLGGELRFHFRAGESVSPCIGLGLGYEFLHFDHDQGSAR